MHEQETTHEFFARQPLSTEQLLPTSASQQLYNTYAERIADFPGFSQRPYHEARDEFEKTIIEADDSSDVAFVRMLLHQLVEPQAYEVLKSDLQSYWEDHGLEGDLATYSYCFLTNHRFFSDLPILAGIMRDIRIEDPFAATRNLMVVGKMIPGMEVDIMGNGQPFAVTPLLSMEARQIQTVPKLPSDATEAMKAQRRVWNDEAKEAMKEAAKTPGNILYIAASGSHDEISHDKKALTLKPVNPETAELLCNRRLKVIPLFFSCDSFTSGGLRASEPAYSLLPPRTLHTKDEVNELMHEIAEHGSQLLAEEFPKGVHYDSGIKQRVASALGKFVHREHTDKQT